MKPTIILLLTLIALAAGHGLMSFPNVRGMLPGSKFVPNIIDEDAPKDHWAHFPSGNKDSTPGAGVNSQKRAAGPKGWTPFTPLDPNFVWRSGVCGDEKIPGKPQAHLRGGEYYYGAKLTETYRQGGTIDISVSIVAHHNGFVQLHVCDVKRCDGEISEKCFRDGYCVPLMRARNEKCETGYNQKCGPIDRNYPERWYLPCAGSLKREHWDLYGGDTISYRLPENLNCEHCVLQFFWSAANTCNPPGVIEYFDGPDGPKWGNCPGQGGAVGGVTRVQRPCGPDRFPEEYLNCADIRILPASGPSKIQDLAGETLPTEPSVDPTPSTSPSPSKEAPPSPKPSYSNTPRPSPNPSQSNTPRPSPNPSPTSTPRPSPNPSQSNTPRPTPKPSVSRTPRPSPKASKSSTPRPSPRAKVTTKGKSTTKTADPSPSIGDFQSQSLTIDSKQTPEPTFGMYPEWSPEESMEPEWSPEASMEYDNPFAPNLRNGLINDMLLIADGKEMYSVENGQIIDISNYEKIAFKVITTRKVKTVEFYIDGEKVWTEHHIEYYMFGNSETSPFYWKDPPLDIWLEVITKTEGEEDVMNIMFTK